MRVSVSSGPLRHTVSRPAVARSEPLLRDNDCPAPVPEPRPPPPSTRPCTPAGSAAPESAVSGAVPSVGGGDPGRYCLRSMPSGDEGEGQTLRIVDVNATRDGSLVDRIYRELL